MVHLFTKMNKGKINTYLHVSTSSLFDIVVMIALVRIVLHYL